MSLVRNSETLLELRRAAQLQQSVESTPNILGDRIIPTMEINPKILKNVTWAQTYVKSTTGSAVQTAFSSSQDTYVTGIIFELLKDATADCGDGQTQATLTMESGQSMVFSIPIHTLTAQNNIINLSFSTPIKLLKGSSSTFPTTSFTVGKFQRIFTVFGYTIDNING